MRKREHFIGLWLGDAEYRHLLKQCALSGLNTSALLRHSIMGVNIQPRPPDTYAALLRELSAIGRRPCPAGVAHGKGDAVIGLRQDHHLAGAHGSLY